MLLVVLGALSMVWDMVEMSKTQKSTLATVSWDIINVYGSIPLFLLFAHWIRLVENYYKWISSKLLSELITSVWYRNQQGKFAGCTFSIILFLASMNIIREYSLEVRVAKFTINSTKLSLLHPFADDLILMSSTVSGAQTFFFLVHSYSDLG